MTKPHTRKSDGKRPEANDWSTLESVIEGVDHMRNEGGIAPEIPHTEERVDKEHGTVNPENI